MCEILSWSGRYSMANELLDAEHQRIMELVNEICGATGSRPQLVDLMLELQEMAETHFLHEESVLDGIYTNGSNRKLRKIVLHTMLAHAREHLKKLDDLRQMRRTLETAAHPCGTTIAARLKEWFLDHATGYDSQVKAIIEAQNAGAAASANNS